MLLVAAIYAGRTHLLFIPLVIVAAASGAILDDTLGFGSGAKGAIACSVALVATFTRIALTALLYIQRRSHHRQLTAFSRLPNMQLRALTTAR